MPVTDVNDDLDTRTLTITAEFAAPVERIWQVYSDPRQLEKVFGPPSYPATFVEHDLTPGGRAHDFMTSPEGEKHYGWWRVTAVESPGLLLRGRLRRRRQLRPGRGHAGVAERVRLRSGRGRHPGHVHEHLRLRRALHKVLEMGIVEGASSAIDQIDRFVIA